MEDRTPQFRMKDVAPPTPTVVPAADLPPGAGSLGLTPASQEGESRKRKREPEDGEAVRRNGPTLEDAVAGVAPYGDPVPLGVSVRHIDCQTFYDDQIARLEALAQAEPDPHARKRAKAKAKHSSAQFDSQEEVWLDYGTPDDGAAPRKKVRTEPTPHRSHASDETADSLPGSISANLPLSRLAHDSNALTRPATWSSLRPGLRVVYEQLALDPLTHTPAVMRFLALITTTTDADADGAGGRSVSAAVLGPLSPTVEWGDEDVQQVVWTEEDCPKLFHVD